MFSNRSSVLGRRAFILLAVGLTGLCGPMAALAADPPDPVHAGGYDRHQTQDDRWSDAAHHRDRIDLVRGAPEFAEDESDLRSEFDAGVEQGWLTRDDFLIFSRQLHQTEVGEARALRLRGGLSESERAYIQGALDEAHRQVGEVRRQSYAARASIASR